MWLCCGVFIPVASVAIDGIFQNSALSLLSCKVMILLTNQWSAVFLAPPLIPGSVC